ncbi:MAG: alpha-L-arabinofuranosidase C-terminal domain-containing protein, partial [Armatimonadota bacterium]
AAFMTGMERNSDHVIMASYAPLFANVNAKAWNPDLIYFDSNKVYGTPSYFVQKLFSQNRVSKIVKSSATNIAEPITPFHKGGIGVGTWITQAEYKDISLTENGVAKQFDNPQSQMKPLTGSWQFDGGTVRQTSNDEGTRCIFPSPNSSNYTLKLKAKKISGREGFLITVGFKDSDNYLWLNLGGWGNTQHAIEYAVSGGKSELGRHINGTIETGRWYDVQIDYAPNRIVCKLDGKTIFDQKPTSSPRFFYTTGIDTTKNELVVKVVQGNETNQQVVINIPNRKTNGVANGFILANNDIHAENSLETPTKISPLAMKAKIENGKLAFTALPYSLTIFRIPIK